MSNPLLMHQHDDDFVELREHIFEHIRARREMDPPPLDRGGSHAEIAAQLPNTITEDGLGGLSALDLFHDVLSPATMSTDHPGMVSLIPNVPTEASILFDYVVSASCTLGSFWLEGAGAVYAENEVLRFIAREAGMPDTAGGAFVQGGTLGNLSALVTARFLAEQQRAERGEERPTRWAFACSTEAHSSLAHIARVMDVDIVYVPTTSDGRIDVTHMESTLADDWGRLFAVVPTGGTTNFGIVDDLAGVVNVARRHDVWVHVDGAYGLAGMLAPSTKPLFAGIEQVDSFIVDPHKWLFAPYDSCALIYRNPAMARAAHTQHASYLDVLDETTEWNPANFAVHLSRRARGLPLWFSLATHGVGAYRTVIESNVEVAREIAEVISATDHLELVREPMLSIVVFRRIGWTHDQVKAWSDSMWDAGRAVCLPSKFGDETVLRFAIINPRTTVEVLTDIIESLR
jgi:glutamate/tyrosine decarboxylase-like PLP-dependent enzyme